MENARTDDWRGYLQCFSAKVLEGFKEVDRKCPGLFEQFLFGDSPPSPPPPQTRNPEPTPEEIVESLATKSEGIEKGLEELSQGQQIFKQVLEGMNAQLADPYNSRDDDEGEQKLQPDQPTNFEEEDGTEEILLEEISVEEAPEVEIEADLTQRGEVFSEFNILEEFEESSSKNREENIEAEISEDFSPEFREDFAAVQEEIPPVLELKEEIHPDFTSVEVREIEEKEVREQILEDGDPGILEETSSPDFSERVAEISDLTADQEGQEEIQSVLEIGEEIPSDFKSEEARETEEEMLEEKIFEFKNLGVSVPELGAEFIKNSEQPVPNEVADPDIPVEGNERVNLASKEEGNSVFSGDAIDFGFPVEVEEQENSRIEKDNSSKFFSTEISEEPTVLVPVITTESSAKILEQESLEGAKPLRKNFPEPKGTAPKLRKPYKQNPMKGRPRKMPKIQKRRSKKKVRRRKNSRARSCLKFTHPRILPGEPKPLVLVQDIFLVKLKTRWKEFN